MCTAIIIRNWSIHYPVIVGFNRDHLYSRGGLPPRWFDGKVPFFAPVDPASRGTWLGLNAAGLIVGTVDRKGINRSMCRRSRGQLLIDALGTCDSLASLEKFFSFKRISDYPATSLFGLSVEAGFVLSWTRDRKTHRLRTGCSILTEGGLNVRCRRVIYVQRELATLKRPSQSAVKIVRTSLCEHASSQRSAYTTCCHGSISGTISSQLILLSKSKQSTLFFHADGAPCKTPFECAII